MVDIPKTFFHHLKIISDAYHFKVGKHFYRSSNGLAYFDGKHLEFKQIAFATKLNHIILYKHLSNHAPGPLNTIVEG